MPDHLQAGDTGTTHDFRGLVGGPIVDHDDLEIAKCLRSDAVECAPDDLGLIESWNDHAHHRRPWHRISSRHSRHPRRVTEFLGARPSTCKTIWRFSKDAIGAATSDRARSRRRGGLCWICWTQMACRSHRLR